MRALVVIATVLGLATTATADPERLAYVTHVLDATQALGPAGRATLERDLYTAARTDCRTTPPAVDCLTGVAHRACKNDERCELAADVVVTNLRAANDWVDQGTRAGLVRASTDYRAALAAELHKRFAALAAELVVVDAPAPAAAIDQLCVTRDRTVHACRAGDPTCVPSLPWSRCVAALVWYVGGAR